MGEFNWRQWVPGALLLLAATGAAAFLADSYMGDHGPGDSCARQTLVFPGDQPMPTVHHAVLVDTTDRFDAGQTNILQGAIDAEAQRTHRCERFSVFSVNSADPVDPPLAAMPNTTARGSEGHGWDWNYEYHDAQWKAQFAAPLARGIAKLLQQEPQQGSPIIESIWGIARRADFGPGVLHRRLVIVSDLLQNSKYREATITQYSKTPMDFDRFANSDFGRFYSPDLRKVEVEIYYIQRPEFLQYQTREHCQFWWRFFRRAGAVVTIHGGPQGCDANTTAAMAAD